MKFLLSVVLWTIKILSLYIPQLKILTEAIEKYGHLEPTATSPKAFRSQSNTKSTPILLPILMLTVTGLAVYVTVTHLPKNPLTVFLTSIEFGSRGNGDPVTPQSPEPVQSSPDCSDAQWTVEHELYCGEW